MFDPIWDFSPVLFFAKTTFEPSFQIRQISEAKELTVAFLLWHPDCIPGEVGVVTNRPTPK